MGRRALREIPLNTDLSRYLIQLDATDPPLDIRHVFAAEAPLEVEIGSGKGLFLSSAASAHPDRNYLGIEIAGKYARFIAASLARKQLTNARIVHDDAERFLRDQLPDDSTSAIHVYFPDPWWKRRHQKRRIMNERFLLQVTRVLCPGGRLHFWTDVLEYFRLTEELIDAKIPLQGPLPVTELTPVHDLDYRTHFERRTRLEGLPVYRASYVNDDPQVADQEGANSPIS